MVSYLRFLVVVWNSLPPLWLLWAVEMMTAMENPDQRDDNRSDFKGLNMHIHHNKQPSKLCRKTKLIIEYAQKVDLIVPE